MDVGIEGIPVLKEGVFFKFSRIVKSKNDNDISYISYVETYTKQLKMYQRSNVIFLISYYLDFILKIFFFIFNL